MHVAESTTRHIAAKGMKPLANYSQISAAHSASVSTVMLEEGVEGVAIGTSAVAAVTRISRIAWVSRIARVADVPHAPSP